MTSPASRSWRLRIELFGWQAFYRRPVRAALLEALDTLGPLGPDHAGTGDGPLRPIDRRQLIEEPLGPGPVVLELARLQAPRWQAFVNLGDRAWMSLVVPPATLEATGARLWFDLGDTLVKALQPDLTFIHVEPDLPPGAARRRLDAGVPAGDDYYEQGPRGLALRTCFGPRLSRQLGERLTALAAPAVVRDGGDACLCVDLVADPWDADDESLLRGHERAINALRPAGIFAEEVQASDGSFTWRPPTGADLGGIARESAHGLRLDPQARADGGDAEPDPSVLMDAVREGQKVTDVVLSWADVRGADLTGLVADGLDLSWAQLENSRLNGARIVGGSFDSANLDHAALDLASVDDSVFDSSIAAGASLRGAAIDRCSFRDAVLTGADFADARLTSASFDSAMLGDARFDRAELRGCSFANADCTRSSFAGAVLQRVDFAEADLRGADFSGATLDNVSFEGALRDA